MALEGPSANCQRLHQLVAIE